MSHPISFRMGFRPGVFGVALLSILGSARAADRPADPREMFRALGVSDVYFEQLTNDTALDDEETDCLLRILYRMRRFPPSDLEHWALDQAKLDEAVRRPGTFRGSIFRLRGRVVEIEPIRPNADQSQRYEMKQYFRCRLAIESPARTADVFTENVPAAWLAGGKPDADGGALAAFLKVGAKSDEQAPLLFVAPRLAWYTDNLLGRLGMDYGLLDDLWNRKDLTDSERDVLDSEAFYALLAAVGRAAPGQLLEQADADLPNVPERWRWTNRQGVEQYSVVPLFNEPRTQVGRLVALSGTARRVEEVRVEDPQAVARYGFDHYYQVSLFTEDCYAPAAPDSKDYQGNPITFCVLELPEGMPYGAQPHYGESVRVAGFFFKTWQYRVRKEADGEPTPDGKTRFQLSPLLIGRSLEWTPPTVIADSTTTNAVVITILVAVMLVIWAAAWRSSRREKRRLAGKAAGPLNFGEDIDLDQVETRDPTHPDFGRIAAMDHGPEQRDDS